MSAPYLFFFNPSLLYLDIGNTLKEPFDNVFIDNVLIYMSGFIMHLLVKKEPCDLCYTYFKECNDTVSYKMNETTQRGGLIRPIEYVVKIVKLCNRKS